MTSHVQRYPQSTSTAPAVLEKLAPKTNIAAAGIPFFTPEQSPPVGTALKVQPNGKPIPKLFTPLKVRGLLMPNRIWVSPMGMCSAHEGFHTPWHLAHYGSLAQRGPGLLMIEVTAVQANGRSSPEDSGIWLDAHVENLRKTVDLAHSQNALIAIQLGHAGRKASGTAPWLSGGVTPRELHGWPDDVVGPTDEAWDDTLATPRSMTLAEIKKVKEDFVSGTKRSIAAGFDVIELHFAHGYLVSSFLTPAVNTRTDQYGGNFENRTRLALEIVEEVRAVMPETMPLFVRISATDWLEANPEYKGESWTIDQSIKLAPLLAERGVDVLDVSSGANHPMQKIISSPGYQAPFSKLIKKAVGDKMLVSAVGNIKSGNVAEDLIVGGKDEDDTPLDLIASGRLFLKNPGLVWAWADDLNVSIHTSHQFGWGFGGRGTKKVEVLKALMSE
ncbi:putative NADPH dehydrogenase C23G7.10c [Neonectria ditissima]|uniref:Putative NADPH dehydrogenase C23G7.10c n=1 Tax=Neonectria ditissima TaxID=78410 RepID=A0A0P7AS67_9HYPO|nr:putative NADPH dehydrogenase C23G7.10c [Neonectria ditissima]